MTKQIGVLGGFFDPSGMHHREIAIAVAPLCDELIIVPSGNRPDWPGKEMHYTASIDRARMAQMTFGDLLGVRIDLFDINNPMFATAIELEERYRPEGAVWHVVGGDWITGAGDGRSVIQEKWHRGRELWQKSGFIVIPRDGVIPAGIDLPPRHQLLVLHVVGSGAEIRERVAQGLSITGLVMPEAEDYIYERGLYTKKTEGK